MVEYTCTCISHAFFDETNGSIESGLLNVEWKGSVWKLCKKNKHAKTVCLNALYWYKSMKREILYWQYGHRDSCRVEKVTVHSDQGKFTFS